VGSTVIIEAPISSEPDALNALRQIERYLSLPSCTAEGEPERRERERLAIVAWSLLGFWENELGKDRVA